MQIKKIITQGKSIVTKANITEKNAFAFGVFTWSRKDGPKRIKLSLKRLNKFIDYNNFKMESPKNVSEITRPEVYMVPINLKDDFYLATVHKKHQQFLKYFEEGYLKFVYMPNSCKQAM